MEASDDVVECLQVNIDYRVVEAGQDGVQVLRLVDHRKTGSIDPSLSNDGHGAAGAGCRSGLGRSGAGSGLGSELRRAKTEQANGDDAEDQADYESDAGNPPSQPPGPCGGC